MSWIEKTLSHKAVGIATILGLVVGVASLFLTTLPFLDRFKEKQTESVGSFLERNSLILADTEAVNADVREEVHEKLSDPERKIELKFCSRRGSDYVVPDWFLTCPSGDEPETRSFDHMQK